MEIRGTLTLTRCSVPSTSKVTTQRYQGTKVMLPIRISLVPFGEKTRILSVHTLATLNGDV